jgi:hypothetical protein
MVEAHNHGISDSLQADRTLDASDLALLGENHDHWSILSKIRKFHQEIAVRPQYPDARRSFTARAA